MKNPQVARALIIVLIGLVALTAVSGSMFLTIDPGEKGVIFKRFGGGLDRETVYGQGFHVIAPWNQMYVYDVKIQENFEKMVVLSKNGLTIKIDLSYWYNPIEDKIGYLHDQVGTNYHNKIILAKLRSVTREVIGSYLPEELYSTKREAIEDEIKSRSAAAVIDKYIHLDEVLIRDVTLPATLQAAIEQKLKQEQQSLEYEFKIEKEEKEASRKRIEAQGISDFQKIVTKTITPQLLKWKGIEATETLAESPNAKVIVIGSGSDDLPIILGGN